MVLFGHVNFYLWSHVVFKLSRVVIGHHKLSKIVITCHKLSNLSTSCHKCSLVVIIRTVLSSTKTETSIQFSGTIFIFHFCILGEPIFHQSEALKSPLFLLRRLKNSEGDLCWAPYSHRNSPTVAWVKYCLNQNSKSYSATNKWNKL